MDFKPIGNVDLIFEPYEFTDAFEGGETVPISSVPVVVAADCLPCKPALYPALRVAYLSDLPATFFVGAIIVGVGAISVPLMSFFSSFNDMSPSYSPEFL